MWLDTKLGVAIDQVQGTEKIPLTNYFFWPKSNIWEQIKNDFNDLLAVEMEGAAVAQVAEQEKIPWLILRVISDTADESSQELFPKFIAEYNKLSWILIETLVENLDSAPIFLSN